ncbi:MAG: NAD-dependent epimerase/dehydratase family protein [Patescibacteria group bacterium]
MSKILITGGAGFIGSHLVKKLIDQGHRIVIVDNLNKYYDPQLKKDRLKIFLKNYKFDFYKIDIANYNELKQVYKKYKFNKIIHIAAQAGVRYSLDNPSIYEKSNILGTLNLLELCRHFKIKDFIFASSSSVYGSNEKLPFSENDRVDNPISIYAATKKSNEEMAFTYHHLFGLNCLGFRFFTVYGPWGRPDMALFKFTKNILDNKPIDVYNNGEMARDFTYIDDIVDGVISAIEKCQGYEVFNLARGKSIKLLDFISEIENNLSKKAIMSMMPIQAGDVTATSADISKAQEKLNYNPKISVDKGVKNFIDWYKDYYKIKF